MILPIYLLRNTLHYNKKTGIWTRLSDGRRADKPQINRGKVSYRGVYFLRQKIRAHRLAWFYVTGKWPFHGLDHKDRDDQNNRWRNLRACNQVQNAANCKLYKTNTSGHKGVYWYKKNKKWCAQIMNGHRRHLGYYTSRREAQKVYMKALRDKCGAFACAG